MPYKDRATQLEYLRQLSRKRYNEHKKEILKRQKERYYANIEESRKRGRESSRKWRIENREHHLAYERNYRLTHKEQIYAQKRKDRTKLKIEILTHYGNGKCGCVKCGESRLACLSIDHIKGDGNKQRGKMRPGATFYRWLRRNNYPQGYQTLCMNCQWIKRVESDYEVEP